MADLAPDLAADAAALLRHAADLIAGEVPGRDTGWTTGRMCQVDGGRRCYCAVGALLADLPRNHRGARIFAVAHDALARRVGYIPGWNDSRASAAPVVATLREVADELIAAVALQCPEVTRG